MMVLECDSACGRPIADIPPIRKAYYCAFRKLNPPDDITCLSKEECATDNSIINSKSDIDLLTRSPRSVPSGYHNKSSLPARAIQ